MENGEDNAKRTWSLLYSYYC